MKQYISEERALYEDSWHGAFSKKLAQWAIDKMKTEEDGKMRQIAQRTLNDVEHTLIKHGVKIPEKHLYTAWYLFNMAVADYPKALRTDEERALFVEETLCDPDGCPENVLDCFVAKMCNAGQPIFWEEML